MEKVILVEQMRKLDSLTISNGVDSKELMYRAAMGVYKSYNWNGKIGIFCGSGNNAGDGYALAVILYNNGFIPNLILTSNKFSDDGLFYYNQCEKLNIPITMFDDKLKEYDIYVDALLGTGFKGEPRGVILNAIKHLNSVSKPVISIDINSGLNGDNGLCSYAVKSDLTVSIGYLKPGLFLNKAKDFTKKIINVDIGILPPEKYIKLLQNDDIKNFFKSRMNFSNKGTYGYVGIMGGSTNYPGAIRLADLGVTALRCGCGVSRVIVAEEIYDLIINTVIETTVSKIPSLDGKMLFNEESIKKALVGLKVLGIGVGWGESREYEKILEYILLNYEIPIIIDADGINTLARMDLSILNNCKAKVVLTPHLKEFSRLSGYSVPQILENTLQFCEEFVLNYNVTLLLKGPTTIVINKNNTYLINNGNSGMATAGSGDILTGIITGLLGYHFEDLSKTVAVAAYINGFAGDLAAIKYGEIGMLSSDTAKNVALAIKNIME